VNVQVSMDYKAIKPYLLAPIAQALLDTTDLKDTDFEVILNDPDHTFYSEATRLYGCMQLGQVVLAAGGDARYWASGRALLPYRSTNGALKQINLGTLFTEWAVAYQDEGGLRTL
jgi:hypothetical protein